MNMTSAPQPARSLSVEYLLHDHTECDALMRELEALLDKQNAAPQWTAEYSATYRRICGFFRETVIGHIRREEEVLYKALEEFLPRDTGPLAVLRAEHHEISAAFERLCALGRAFDQGSNSPEQFAELETTGRRLIRVLQDHVYKEDRVFFPMIARYFSPDRDRFLLEQMKAIPPLPCTSQ